MTPSASPSPPGRHPAPKLEGAVDCRLPQLVLTAARSSTGRRLSALQGLRWFAAVLVVCDHAISDLVKNARAVADTNFAHFLGGVGVAVFFVISGFVMTYAHGKEFGQSSAWREFYIRRIGRIVPIYWLFTLFYSAYLTFGGRGPSPLDILKSLLFIPYMDANSYWHPVLGVGWTLNYEALFYLIFGVALLWRRGVWLVLGFFCSVIAAGVAGAFGNDNVLAFWSSPIVLYFLAGVAIGLLHPHVKRGMNFAATLVFVSCCIAVDVLCATLWGAGSLASQVIAVPAAILPVAACAFAHENGSDKTLMHGLCGLLGGATYSIYLTHTLVIGPLSKVASALDHSLGVTTSVWLFVLSSVFLCSAVGVTFYEIIERRLIAVWRRKFHVTRLGRC